MLAELLLLTLFETDDCILQVADVKKNIETVQGSDVYPVAKQMLIHQGKVLKDGTTLEENQVAENSFVVIMLTKVTIVLLSCWESEVNCSIIKFQ